jgi:dihydrofolate synthase/folylpolyglutamate synthase
MRLGLARMRDFLAAIGDPQARYPVAHVGGTNGKGSVCQLLGAMARAHGLHTGVHTSPHLQAINERFELAGAPVDDATLDAGVHALDQARRAWARQALPPNEAFPLTYFEFTVALAFRLFADAEVDLGVIEVGMGGRLDATNVVRPAACAIVTIGLDHCDHLGRDHASIAGEKAGILKSGVPAVVGPLPHEALQVVRSVARERDVPLSVWGEDFEVSGDLDGFRYRGASELDGLSVPLLGDHQLVNAGVALRLAEILPDRLRPSPAAMRDGLLAVRHPGRMEWLATDLLVDGAHNPDGAVALAAYLARRPRQRGRTLVLGGGTDKDLRAVAAALAPQVDRIFTTACDHPKARTPMDVAAELEGIGVPTSPAGNVADALAFARERGDLVIVAGSLYLVGAVRDAVLGAAP